MRVPLRLTWTRRRGLWAALAVVALTNAAVFAHVAWNRAGGAVAVLDLTDRELQLPYRAVGSDEDTGLALRLDVQRPAPWDDEDSWLDRRKLAELGFDVRLDPDAEGAGIRYRNVLPREVWLVLEMEGEAWRRWLAEGEREVDALRRDVARGEKGAEDLRAAEASLRRDRVEASRLFVVDAGLDRDALRRRYGDGGRHAVVPGTVRLVRLDPPEETPRLAGTVGTILVDRVHVPLRHRAPVVAAAERRRREMEARERRWTPALDRLEGRASDDEYEPIPPVLQAELAVGRLGEPWLATVEQIEPAPVSQNPPDVPRESPTDDDPPGE